MYTIEPFRRPPIAEDEAIVAQMVEAGWDWEKANAGVTFLRRLCAQNFTQLRYFPEIDQYDFPAATAFFLPMGTLELQVPPGAHNLGAEERRDYLEERARDVLGEHLTSVGPLRGDSLFIDFDKDGMAVLLELMKAVARGQTAVAARGAVRE